MEKAKHVLISFILIAIGSIFLNAYASDVTTGKTAYVHLFEWKWTDIAQECEQFLGPKGFAAVQVSPPNEHAVLEGHPWFERYQPVSYKLESRSGTRAEFIDMVRRCKTAGVRIYVDAVINHMAQRRGPQTGINGSPFRDYDFPGTYAPWDFHHCGRNGNDQIDTYQDRWVVQNCELNRLPDLDTGSEYVRNTIAGYLQDLLDIGVAGFRIDAAKHIPADDIRAIYAKLDRDSYPYQEVIDHGGEPISSTEYFTTGDVIEFRYGAMLWDVFNGHHGQNLSRLEVFGPRWGFVPDHKAIVFIDNHDQQRGHGAGGNVLTYRDGQKYALANAFMLAWPYGYPQVMSSYRFSNGDQGPPSDSQGHTKNVFENGVSQCGKDWICEHRWSAIANMVGFRNATQRAPYVTRWWSNGGNLIAFARGNLGYFVLNGESSATRRWFDTGLPEGEYCNVISGEFVRGTCTGNTVRVSRNGWAEISIPAFNGVAIHAKAKLPARRR